MPLDLTQDQATHAAPQERPLLVTIICLLGFLGGIGGYIIALQVDDYRKVGTWVPPIMAATFLTELVAMINLWQMRRWAVFVYAAVVGVNAVVSVIVGAPLPFVIPLIALHVAFVAYLLKAVR